MGNAPEELPEPPQVIKGVITDMALPSKQLLRYWGVGLTKHIPNPSLGCVIFGIDPYLWSCTMNAGPGNTCGFYY